MTEVFISYVREDAKVVDFLVKILEKNGIKVWLDRTQLEPGTRWKDSIENAIRRGVYFISFHSRSRQNKVRTYANEELGIAIEEIRLRSENTIWFIPVKIDDCTIESRRIGSASNLSDFQFCDLTDWKNGIVRLLKALECKNPIGELSTPLAQGVPSSLEVTTGHLIYDYIDDAPAEYLGIEYRVSGGWIRRGDDDKIICFFQLKAPLQNLQNLNDAIGYGGFHAYCDERTISTDPSDESTIKHSRKITILKGTILPSLDGKNCAAIPFDLDMTTSFEVRGHLLGGIFKGTFGSDLVAEYPNGSHTQKCRGRVEAHLRDASIAS